MDCGLYWQVEASFSWNAIEERLTIQTAFAALRLGSYSAAVGGITGNPMYFYAGATVEF